uniref:G-patch domain-containing protein n=1 Tax=Arion vulgaris TaxID=1028688 RepID=A0A0B7AJ79_9EUPU
MGDSKDIKDGDKLNVQLSKGDIDKHSKNKDKSSDKELEGSRRRDKEADKKRKRSNSRSRSPNSHKRSRSGSRSKSPKRHGSSSSTTSRYSEWDARRYSDDPSKFSSRDQSRSRSKERSSDKHRRSSDSSKSHQLDSNKEGSDRDLRTHIDKAKLRKIAIANALQNMRAGQGPQVDLTVVKSGGKSVQELTEFCKRISEKSHAKAGSDYSNSSDGDGVKDSDDDDDMLIHHPFKVKEANSSGIVMNIRNAKQLPVLTPSEKQAQQATLRLTFPVSSGSHHRASESEWVPVVKTPAADSTKNLSSSSQVTSQAPALPAPPPPPNEQKKVDNIFPLPSEAQKIDICSIITERLQAVRKLQENPFDMQALSKMHQVQEQASKWATSRHLPGQFTGSTGAQVLSQEQLIGDRRHQAWVKKLSHAAPVNGGIGMFLLQKMGWKQGEGLGKNNEGSREPLMLDIKVDRRGLTTAAEFPRHKAHAVGVPRAKDLSNKHPVSALMELCNRRRWGLPLFTVVSESGPDHKKSFLFKVMVNNVEYQPTMASSNKKTAKAQCAAICLQEMGLLPRDAPLNI